MPEYHSGKNYTSSSSSSEISSSAGPSARMQRLKQRKQENQPKSTDPAKKQQLLSSFDERVAPSEQEDNVKVTSPDHDVEVEEKQSTSQYSQPELKTPATKPESTLPKLIEQGEQAYEQQDYLSAYDLFSEVVSQQPDNPTALFHLSVSANQTGNHAVAIETTQQLMDSGHYTAQACYFQAQSLEELGRKQQAAIAYQKAGAEIPEAKNAFMRLEEERLLGGFNRQPVKSSDRDKAKTTKQTQANAYQSPIKSAVAETSHSDIANLSSVEKLGEAVSRGAKALPAALAEELKALFSPTNAASLVAVAGVYIAAHATGIGQAMDIGMLIAGGIFFGLDAFTIFKDLAGFARAINATTEKELDRAGEDLADAIAKIGVDAVMTLLTRKVADEIGKSVDNLNQVDEVHAHSDNVNSGQPRLEPEGASNANPNQISNQPQTNQSSTNNPADNQKLAEYSGKLRDAIKGKGNFGIGTATEAEATEMGKAWVREGYTVASDGKTLVSSDGLRQFRPPSYKPRLNKKQANFEWRNIKKGQWQGNGHLDIAN